MVNKGAASIIGIIIVIIVLAIILYVAIDYSYVTKEFSDVVNNTTNISDLGQQFKDELTGDKLFELVYKCPVKSGFNVICTNEEIDETTGEILLEKVGDCNYETCYKDVNEIEYGWNHLSSSLFNGIIEFSPNCSTLIKFQDPWENKYDDLTIPLYYNSECNGLECKREDKIVGQCLRLNFDDYYGKSIYVDNLCYRAGAGCYFPSGYIAECKDIKPNIYIFTCHDGDTCSDNGVGWEYVEGPENGAFESENAFDIVSIKENIKMVDICVLNENFHSNTAPHKIAWVKFTTNEIL